MGRVLGASLPCQTLHIRSREELEKSTRLPSFINTSSWATAGLRLSDEEFVFLLHGFVKGFFLAAAGTQKIQADFDSLHHRGCFLHRAEKAAANLRARVL